MKIDYTKIIKKNMINVFKDVLLNIKANGLKDGHHLYITFNTQNSNIIIPNWLKEKYSQEMTIVIQYEYWNFKVNKDSFNISLSFDNIKTDMQIPFESVISFADPYANFGLKLINDIKIDNKKLEKEEKINKKSKLKIDNESNIIDFNKFRKN